MKRIAIIGGGITGLAAAHRAIELSNERHTHLKLTLFEASARPGGTIQTETHDGFLLERGPDAFISEKPEALALAKRLDLTSQIIETNTQYRRSFIVSRGHLRPVPDGFQLLAPSRLWPFITSDIFSLPGKIRMAADLFLPRRSENGSDDESLASFVRRRLGHEALERMAQPMVGGIYTADPEVLSLRSTLPRFLEMEKRDRSLILALWRRARQARNETGVSGARYSLFLSFAQGMNVLVDALVRKICSSQLNGLVEPEIRTNTKVTNLVRLPGGEWLVTTPSGPSLTFDAVCLAVPAYVAGELLRELAPTLRSRLNKIKYASSATVNIGFRRNDIAHELNGFGFVVPLIEGRSLIACTFSSVKFPGRAPDGYVLLRAFLGGALQPEMLTLEDGQIADQIQTDLNDLLGVRGLPLFTEIVRWNDSMPQYEVGHLERVTSIEAETSAFPGLALAGNSYRGAGIPDCIRSGETAIENLMKSVTVSPIS